MRLYTNLYLALGIPLFAVSLFFPVLQIAYALLFFGVTGVLIFNNQAPPDPDPQHSGTTHFETNSRMNWFNYGVSALIAVSALVYVFSPINKAVTILILWSAAVYLLKRLWGMAESELQEDMIFSYLHEQLPNIDPLKLSEAIHLLGRKKEFTAAKLSDELDIPVQDAEKLKTLYSNYPK